MNVLGTRFYMLFGGLYGLLGFLVFWNRFMTDCAGIVFDSFALRLSSACSMGGYASLVLPALFFPPGLTGVVVFHSINYAVLSSGSACNGHTGPPRC
ncbi:MAG: hypothetical protein ABIH11_04850 [Candidatus Altiarchaeota archaeon]